MAKPALFTPEQQAAHDEMKALIADAKLADQTYDNLPSSKGGKIISTDLARFLDKRYAGVPSGQGRDLMPGWDLAWRYAQNRLERELLRREDRTILRLMAGGWAAGKTHALENTEDPDLAWDGTLQDTIWATGIIDLALSEGWRVEIAYVYRDLELAFYGAIERASKEGRTVPFQELPRVHRNVQTSIVELTRSYGTDENVDLILLHNVGTASLSISPLEIKIADLAPQGALHYTEAHERYFSKAASHLASS